MNNLNRMSQNRPGLSTHRLDGRIDLAHDSAAHKDLLERASVMRVSGGRSPEAKPEPKPNPIAEFFCACARKLSAWAHKIFG